MKMLRDENNQGEEVEGLGGGGGGGAGEGPVREDGRRIKKAFYQSTNQNVSC